MRNIVLNIPHASVNGIFSYAGENNHQVRDICYQIHRQCPKTDLMLLPPPIDVPNVRSNMNWNGADGFVFEYTEPLFEDAARFVVHCQMAYTSMLQRYYSIGYNRANRLLLMLERAGIVSLVTKSGARDVLVKDNSSLQSLLNDLKMGMIYYLSPIINEIINVKFIFHCLNIAF